MPMLGLWRSWRRRRWRKDPFPEEWRRVLEKRVPFWGQISAPLRPRFEHMLTCFIREKAWIPAGGMELSDDVRVVIAATAVRLVLHLDLSYLDRLTEIVVYPAVYKHPEGDGAIFGEAHRFGTVVLAWDAVTHGVRNPRDGEDTATHEFAHVLDRATGAFDGTPMLAEFSAYRSWADIMSRNFKRLRRRDRRQRRVLRAYGATNEAEFFAVATESFFEKSKQMRTLTPELYEELKSFYGHDPAA